MRILLAHNRYRSVGGEERHIDLLDKWLREADIEVRRFEVSSPREVSLFQRLKLGMTLTYRPEGGRLTREVLARQEPDIVHFHNVFPLLTPAAFREAHRSGARVVLTIHNYRFACPAATLLRNGAIHEDCIEGSSLLCGLRNARGVWSESIAYGIAIELQRRLRLLHRWVDAYVAPSEFVGRMLARAGYPENRIHVISHGTPIAEKPSRAGSYALFVGRLSPEKGTRTLIAAARLAPDVPILVAGDGPLRSVAEAAGGNVSSLGYADRAYVDELVAGARFVVMPSEWYEGQPYGMLESMAAGTPLVASRIGALAEHIEDGVTGVLVPPGEPALLAAAMRDLWADESRAADLGEQAWLYARKHFGREMHVERLRRLYHELSP